MKIQNNKTIHFTIKAIPLVKSHLKLKSVTLFPSDALCRNFRITATIFTVMHATSSELFGFD